MKATNEAVVAQALLEGVLAAGDEGVPAGHLYALSMGAVRDLEQFEFIVRVLVSAGWIKRRGLHLLVATDAGRAILEKREVVS